MMMVQETRKEDLEPQEQGKDPSKDKSYHNPQEQGKHQRGHKNPRSRTQHPHNGIIQRVTKTLQ